MIRPVEALLILGLLAAVIVLAIALARSRRTTEPQPAKDPLRRESPGGLDPRRLKPGDVVRQGARDWIVRGTLSFDQDGFEWQEHLLDDATTRRWLSVEDDEELEIVLWESVTAPELTPGPGSVEHGGVTYRLDEHGEATYKAEGSTGTPATGRVEYYDYTAGDRRLAFERYGTSTSSWEVGTGVVINERELDIYPAPRQ